MKPIGSEIKTRWQFMDALRGLAVCLMVIHHLLYDLYYFGFAPYEIFSNPLFDCLHYLFLGVFILLSGISSRFSHNNCARGLKLVVCAALVTLVTWLIGAPAWFGVMHFLAVAILLYCVVRKLLDRLPFSAGVYVSGILFCLSWLFIRYTQLDWKILWIFGKDSVLNIYSADYVPLFPWLFVFCFGTVLGAAMRKRTPPKPVDNCVVRFLSAVGQHSLIIYMLHQVVLYGAVWCAAGIANML